MKCARFISVAVLVAGLALGLSVGCRNKSGKAPDATPMADEKTAVCLWDGVGLREAAGRSSKYLASMNLGESVKLLGDTAKDEGGKDWHKVQLSDGKTGFAPANCLVAGAVIGAVKDDATLYKRPDPLTADAQKAKFMTIVAVTQQKDGWVQVMGEGRRTLGWLNKDVVSLDRDEVTSAILATKKLREKNGMETSKKVDAILASAPNPGSYFLSRLREKYASAAPEANPAPAAEPVAQ